MGGGEVVRPRSWRRAFLATAIDDKPATLLLGLKGIPSRRTLSRFDEVMGEYGLWGEAWLALVRRNLETGAIAPSDSFVADTAHLEADSILSDHSEHAIL